MRTRIKRCTASLAILMASIALGVANLAQAADDLGFRVPEGFEVSLYAGDELAHDIYSMTIDAHGRVVVAGRGYVKILHDDNHDGRADRATLFSNKPASGAHGMYFEGDDLICTGDDALMKLRDTNGDGVADGAPEIWSRLRSPEHGANGVVKGPDGWIYVACGNDAEVSEKHASTPYSPVKKPECGAIVRFSPDGKRSEIFAHGFRNPYDLDFNPQGHLFTVDADGERDQYLPWYAPTRLFDVAQGMHHGWVLRGWTRSWNRPAYFFDNVERLVEIGRGSPTGLVCYRHRQFPAKYWGGIFSACWTLGKIYYFPLTAKGSSYTSQTENFMETTGLTGFAPVDLAVGPDGDLFVAIGGRGTRGSVFRVRYTKTPLPKPIDGDELNQVVNADQPLSSWSRAKWAPLARKLGSAPFDRFVRNRKTPPSSRLACVRVLTEVFGGLTSEGIDSLTESDSLTQYDRDEKTAAAMAVGYSLGRGAIEPSRSLRIDEGSRQSKDATDEGKQPLHAKVPYKEIDLVNVLVMRTADDSQLVVRAAWEGLQSHALEEEKSYLEFFNFGATDRRVREAALIAAHGGIVRWSAEKAKNYRESFLNQGVGYLRQAQSEKTEEDTSAMRRSIGAIRFGLTANGSLSADAVWPLCDALAKSKDSSTRLEILRLIQVACGDVRTTQQQPDFYAGYAAADPARLTTEQKQRLIDLVTRRYPWTTLVENYEVCRLFSMLETPNPNAAVSTALCTSKTTSPTDDIHFLIVLSRLPSERSGATTMLTAIALAELHAKMAARKWEPSRNWPLVVGEMFDELCKRDPALADTLIGRPPFGRPEHSLFAARMKGDAKAKAARRLLEYAKKSADDVRWTAEMVNVVASLPAAEALPALRERWEDDYALRDAIALVLAKNPVADDRTRLVAALASTQADVVRAAADALAKLPAGDAAKLGPDLGAALRTLRSYTAGDRGDKGQFRAARQSLAALARHWSGKAIEVDESAAKDGAAKSLAEVYRPWFDWFAQAFPDEAKKVSQSAGVDAAAWAKRLAAVKWDAGDAARGKVVFERRSCVRCHSGNGPLGPDLAGAAKRFARDDLFAAVYDPNRDVSPLYQTTQVTTRTGQTYFGLLVYESPEGSLVQTGPDTTIRITDEDPAARRPSRQSLMPTGLLDEAKDEDLADLYKYLMTLDGKAGK